jgi:hypothetical protein
MHFNARSSKSRWRQHRKLKTVKMKRFWKEKGKGQVSLTIGRIGILRVKATQRESELIIIH